MPLRSVVRSTVGLLAVVLLALGTAPAWGTAPAITTQPTVGPPTTALTVQGSGFGSNESVALAFDAQALSSATTDGSGSFTGHLSVPSSATPGFHTVKATGGTSGLSATTAFLVRTDWPQFRYDLAHSGFNPYENILNPSNVSSLVQAWTAPTGSSSYVDSSPAVAGGVVYAANLDGTLYALDAATGAVKWRANAEFNSSPAVANGVVYAASFDRKVYALYAATGEVKWTAKTGSYIESSSPAVANGVVYVGSDDGKVYALGAATGAVKWTATTGNRVDSSPAVANGVVYVGSDDYNVHALDAATGAVKWTRATGSFVRSSPAVANGVVYVGSLDGKVYALDAATGAVKWTTATGQVEDSSPAVANGVVYVGSDDDRVYALDAATGAVKWTRATGWFVRRSSPAVANGVVYVGSWDGKVYALEAATGAVRWTATTGGQVESSPAVANGMVYVGSDDGNGYAFALQPTDLSASIADSADPVTADKSLTYTDTVTNSAQSAEPATGVVLTDAPPPGTILGTVIPSQGSCSGIGPITCGLGTLAPGASATVAVGITPVAPGSITNAATVTSDNAGSTSASQTTTVQAQANTVYQTVTASGFSPLEVRAGQGQTVQWNFLGPGGHSATDRSGLGLFDSGKKWPVSYYRHPFTTAGEYLVRDMVTGVTGTVIVPVKSTPSTGTATTTFTLRWSPAPVPAPLVLDVQVLRPGSTGWALWQSGLTTPRGSFVPDAGPGTYRFRARLRNPATGAHSMFGGWVSIRVT